MIKICNICNIQKSIDNFSKSGKYYRGECIVCHNEKTRNNWDIYYRKNINLNKKDYKKNDFKIGYIYKWSCNGYYYYGRTINKINYRFYRHRKSCFNKRKKEYHSRKYKVLRDICGIKNKDLWDKNVKLELIDIITTSFKDLKEIESYYINTNDIWSLNSVN